MEATLRISFGASLLTTDNLLKRIAGIKIVTEETSQLNRYQINEEQKDVVMANFEKIDLFSHIFNRQKMHIELVKRSIDIIKLYGKNHKITPMHIDRMWDCTQIDETMQIAIYDVIKKSTNCMPDDHLELFMFKIRDMEPNELTIREIDFLHELGKGTYRNS